MKLSIITVNLNNREGLKKTLDSVACQTWRDFEHIIIDGASTDGSVDVIREYAHGFESRSICQEPSATNTSTHVAQPQTHQHISQPSTISPHSYAIKWISEKDTGIYNAMNKGIRMAQGEYILFLNSGDRLIDGGRLAMFFSNEFCEDVVYGYLKFDRGDYIEDGYSPREVTLRTFVEGTIHHTGNAFIRKDAFDRWGLYDETLKIVSDWKWFLQAIGLGTATTKYRDISLSIFDCTGVSESQGDVVFYERKKVLNEVVPPRLLKDYMDRMYIEERMSNQLLSLKNSKAYKVGSLIIIPLKKIRLWLNLQFQ